MSFVASLLLASSIFQFAAASPLAIRSLSCPASNNTVYVTGSHSYTIECGIDRNAGDMPAPNGAHADTLEACIAQCEARVGCVLVDYAAGPKACYVKSKVGYTKTNSGVIGARLVSGSTSVTTSPSTISVASVTAVSTPISIVAVIKTTSTSASATSVSTGVSKRGLCYNNAPMTSFFGGSESKITWMYDWSQTAGSANAQIKYIPMLWSNSADRVASWSANAKAGIAAGADSLLGFNEPDLGSQANMALSTAVSAWKQYMEPFAGQVKLISPAVTNGASPLGLTYLSNFVSQCTGCTIDACAIHWYDSATNIAYFKAYIPQAYTACGNKPIWITEFGASGTEAQIEAFLQTVLPWLDSLDYVERYAYFYDGASTDGTYLVNSAGTGLSSIGQIFNTL